MNLQSSPRIDISEIALFAITRVLAGAGLGLLIADRIEPVKRKTVGWTLLGVGAVTALPLIFEIIGSKHRAAAVDQGAAPSAEFVQ